MSEGSMNKCSKCGHDCILISKVVYITERPLYIIWMIRLLITVLTCGLGIPLLIYIAKHNKPRNIAVCLKCGHYWNIEEPQPKYEEKSVPPSKQSSGYVTCCAGNDYESQASCTGFIQRELSGDQYSDDIAKDYGLHCKFKDKRGDCYCEAHADKSL